MSLVDVTSDQFKSRLRPFGISFEKSLTDLIKGIRANNGDKQKLSQFFDNSIQECRSELKSNDMELKSMAILKLTYLEMYGFDLPFMNFQILEVMSSMKFQHKRIGYLAATQILARENNDDVLMLMTNLLKKDLNSSNHVEVGLAISCLSSIVTRELAQDVIDDLMKMFSHSKAFIRKKAILASYKVFLKYPESLKMNYDRLVDKLDESEDISVISATVNVLCELAKKNPSNCIDLAPKLFALLTTSSNNWMIIRLLKLFSSLSIIEPRLKKKLLPSVIELMSNTKASSLMYECINCILAGKMLSPEDKKVSKLMYEKLLSFVVTHDQNLKYVSILAFIKIINIQPELLRKHQDLVLEWLKDEDLTIRSKSLQLVDGLIDRTNIMNVVSNLLLQLANDENLPPKYKLQISQKVLFICGAANFSSIPNFDWYLATLKDLLHLMKYDPQVMLEISSQFTHLGLRVPSLRASLVEVSLELLMDKTLPAEQWYNNCVWCISEYLNEYVDENEEDEDEGENDIASILPFLLNDSTLKILNSLESSESVLPIYINCVFKVFVKYINKDRADSAAWTPEYYRKIIGYTSSIIKWMESLQCSFSFEIQERSVAVAELFKILEESLKNTLDSMTSGGRTFEAPPSLLTQALPQLYDAYELKPIAQGLQQRLGVPLGLDMDEVLNDTAFNNLMKFVQLESFSDDEEYASEQAPDTDDDQNGHNYAQLINIEEVNDNEDLIAKRKQERLEELKYDPYYISSENTNGDITDSVEKQEDVVGKRKKKKKKKYISDTVMILEEEDVAVPLRREITPSLIPIPPQSASRLKFKTDDSQLANFDLRGDSSKEDNFTGEYEIEKMRQELAKSVVNESAVTGEKNKKKKKKKTTVVSGETKKEVGGNTEAKKKVKKRKALIS